MPPSSPRSNDPNVQPREQKKRTPRPKKQPRSTACQPATSPPPEHDDVPDDEAESLEGGLQDAGAPIFPRQIAKSPSFAFRTPKAPTNQPSQPSHHSPDLLAHHSPPTRYYGERPAFQTPFATRQSPPQPYSLNGSPPTYGTRLPDPWSATGSPSTSPPTSHALPASPRAQHTFARHMTSARQRNPRDFASDLPSQSTALQFAIPPPPHQAQPHFYGAPEIDVTSPRFARSAPRPGDFGYYCGLDSLQCAATEAASTAHNVLMVGFEGGLDIYHAERLKLDRIGRIEGLRGSVIGAKILPWTARKDPFSSRRPLIALTIHGVADADVQGADGGETVNLDFENPTETNSAPASRILTYQTSVEVYSLQTHEHVAVLYASEPVFEDFSDAQSAPPPPIGDLSVSATGRFVSVSSGISGEVYVYTCATTKGPAMKGEFACLGKFWTSVVSTTVSKSVNTQQDDALPTRPNIALHSLSSRWLAIAPPTAPLLNSIKGTPMPNLSAKAPGVGTFAAPEPPFVDCAIDSPDQEGVINRMARGITQEMIKGAQWVGTQGMQAWRNYWSKHQQGADAQFAPNPTVEQWSPPTHGEAGGAADERNFNPTVSIYDLCKLAELSDAATRVPDPIATFDSPGGCSFLSFSPTGLFILTVSHHGDVQYVWDLMRLRPALKTTSNAKPPGPVVRQVAKFQRLTNARVIDVVWSEPKGDKLAVITQKGTIHLFSIPSAAFHWPARRRLLVDRKSTEASSAQSDSSTYAPDARRTIPTSGLLPTTLKTLNGTAKPFFETTFRWSSSGASTARSSASLSLSSPAAALSRKVVTSGVKSSIGAAADSLGQLRHLGENRLRLAPASVARSQCVRFFTGNARGSIGAVSAGILRIHTIPRLENSKAAASSSHSGAPKDFEFALPPLPEERLDPAVRRLITGEVESLEQTVQGDAAKRQSFWTLRHAPADGSDSDPPHPLSLAEIETASPFQPFHLDRRVTLSTFSNDHTASGVKPETWAFGGDVDATTISVGAGWSAPQNARYDSLMDDDIADRDLLEAEGRLLSLGEEEDFEVLEALDHGADLL